MCSSIGMIIKVYCLVQTGIGTNGRLCMYRYLDHLQQHVLALHHGIRRAITTRLVYWSTFWFRGYPTQVCLGLDYWAIFCLLIVWLVCHSGSAESWRRTPITAVLEAEGPSSPPKILTTVTKAIPHVPCLGSQLEVSDWNAAL